VELALAIVTLALLVAWIVLGPLRRGPEIDKREDDRRAALEAAKEAKYREIRDAELDFQMGKLSEEDWKAIDSELREQAISILRQIDRLTPRGPDSGNQPDGLVNEATGDQHKDPARVDRESPPGK
jgi:hypothetical protein